MRRLVVVSLVLLGGCSFVWGEKVRATCWRTPIHVDFGIAGAAAIGAGVAALAITCNHDECNQEPMVDFVIGPALVVGIAALASAAYGWDVADPCDDKRR